ncbi:MAG TPA: heme-binding protein [Ohtaekwangia sp.]|nr:heme-binding protein [Ohtaekwangia sp.]
MYTIEKISSEEARQLIDVVVQEATKINKAVAVAVTGPEGELIAFLRMDGVSPAASRIAQNKAYTSACDRKTTREMGEFMEGQHRPQAYWGDRGITGFGGGVPVMSNGKVIGGIGVSGLSETEDERICHAAVHNVYRD